LLDALKLTQPLEALFEKAPPEWLAVMAPWLLTNAAQALLAFVNARLADGAEIYPAQVLHALHCTPLDAVKVVILGQDPYHGPGQAQGLAFSVPNGLRVPPSLRNMFKELQRDLGVVRTHSDLSTWAQQGVLLLNTTLTVESGQPASHAKRGWEGLTQTLLTAVASRGKPCVYLLWGNHAQQYETCLRSVSLGYDDGTLILKANHPSPLSALRPPIPFLGCGHFGKALKHLEAWGLGPVDWAL
jgi:uracil-DNA glycosylase